MHENSKTDSKQPSLEITDTLNFQHSQTQKMCKVVIPLSETPLLLPECLALTET